MDKLDKKRIAFPIYSHYNLGIKYFVEQALEADYILQPPMTNQTIAEGTKFSPESVCMPFKTTLGSMMEALDAGADTLIMTYGLCRLGYYGELQEKILRDMGYEFDFINLSEYSTGNKKDMLKALRRINSKVSLVRMAKIGAETLKMASYLDEAEAEYYKNCGFEVNKGDMKKVWDDFLFSMGNVKKMQDIEAAYKAMHNGFDAVKLNKPDHALKVGVVGEFFTAVDSFSNNHVEQKLADMGVEVHRWMNVTNRMLHYEGRNLTVGIKDYCKYEMGPTSTANIWSAKNYAARGFDGLIHIKSSGCTPEIDIMPVLQNISHDYKIPILYLTFDSQTSDTGLDTRLEAFYDMISMRKKEV